MTQPRPSKSTKDTTVATIQIVMPGKVEPSGLQTKTAPMPQPGPGQVVLRMEASGISFAEQQMRLGTYYDQPKFPFVPGYDVVGVVTAPGDGGDTGLHGKRFAAVTKIGGWARHVVVEAGDLIPVPAGVTPVAAATVLVNGGTAWQMLYRKANVPTNGTVVVLGANSGVGSTLVQLAHDAGMTVIGTSSAKHHDRVRELGAIPVDRNDPQMYERIRELAPEGVDAVFDHVGGPGMQQSWKLLRCGGTLVAYGSASTKGEPSMMGAVKQLGRILVWSLLPNGRSAYFYNFWAGKARRPEQYRAQLRADITEVLRRIAAQRFTPQIAAEFPLTRAGAALEFAESSSLVGKVVLTAEQS